MGDMKTPDFDDLLAAFDIPDATGLDAKEAIPVSHEEAEGSLKPTGLCMDDVSTHSGIAAPDVPVVSVIVKNTSRQETSESQLGPLLHNGFQSSAVSMDHQHMVHGSFGKFEAAFVNGVRSGDFPEITVGNRPDGMPSFSQFSPISSPEPDDAQADVPLPHSKQEHDERPYFLAASAFASAEQSASDNQKKLQVYSMFDKCHKIAPGLDRESSISENAWGDKNSQGTEATHVRRSPHFGNQFPLDDLQNNTSVLEPKNFSTELNMGVPHQFVKNSSSKLSSCLAALVALNAKKASEEVKDDVGNTRNPLVSVKEPLKISPKVPKSPKSPRSPLEAVKRLIKPPDSPMSICSDSSGKASPSVTTGSPPAIPRVRIKTIKTSSGQIKRTVTSVLPDSELEELQSPAESSPLTLEESPSKDSPAHLMSNSMPDASFENGRNMILEKPGVVGSRLPKVNHVGPEVSTRKANGNSLLSLEKSGRVHLRVGRGIKKSKKGTSGKPGTSPSGFLPKAVHLANLNLVPHSVAASVAARSVAHRPNQPSLPASTVSSSVPLVHRVKSSAPVLSSTLPNNAVGTLNRLLTASNPVPNYVPNLSPPPESQITLPPRGHRCLECGDSFGLEKSLALHYSRRSVHIEVACMHCSKTLVFFNKCSLLAHAREHKRSGKVMQCTQLFMKPIAADQMFAAAESQGSNGSSANLAIEQPTKTQPAMPLYRDKSSRQGHGFRCSECNKRMSNSQALASHYQRLSENTEGMACEMCKMMLPNRCSLKAHQRLHSHSSPHCCPECGAVTSSADIQKHIQDNCLHYSRKTGYKCLHCEVIYTSFNTHKTHVEEKHCETFHRCSLCRIAFKSLEGYQTHIKNKHSDSKESLHVVYKCCCEAVFKKKQLLFQHFHQKAKKISSSVFKCPMCAAIFPKKQELMQHFMGEHRGTRKAEVDRSEVSDESVPHSDQKPNGGMRRLRSASRRDSTGPRTPHRTVSMKNAGWTCGECLHWLPDRETYVAHMKSSHGRSVKRYPCRQCDRSFNSTTSLRRHLRNDHSGKRRSYTCWYCTDKPMTFTKYFMLKNHISLMHGVKNPDFSQMSRAAPQPSAEGLATKRASEEAFGAGAEVGGLVKRAKPQYRCSKCGFTTEDSSQFQEHIPQHKTDQSASQCRHCGLCFTSPLALGRHQFIVHKIKEPEEEEGKEPDEEPEEEANLAPVGLEEDRVSPPVPTDSPEEGGAKKLHCEKCNEVFECETAYNAHVHAHTAAPSLKAVAEQ